jgi:hypothetical protein
VGGTDNPSLPTHNLKLNIIKPKSEVLYLLGYNTMQCGEIQQILGLLFNPDD